ncbi:hypothetical protein Pmani_027798 [Petrolisthes manimaculis]|uniref:F-box only protein 22 n=1 Tax=Petrolisthes manimaculis TaxID=1843537 RepID=A0AAE1P1D4_9EUCA|nr:hypothetical protein Pmani_027798 [Petrolisthes manimaculis]
MSSNVINSDDSDVKMSSNVINSDDSDIINSGDSDSCIQIGNLLSGSWELTQKIFKSLSYREVSRVREVCRTWADVGVKILEQRRRLHYLTVHPHGVLTTHGKFAVFESSTSSLFENFFEHLLSKPQYCLAFSSTEWFTRNLLASVEDDNNKCNVTLVQNLKESLPATCELGVVCAVGVIGTVESSYQNHWRESGQQVNQEILTFLSGEDEKEAGKIVEEEKTDKRSVRTRGRMAAAGKGAAEVPPHNNNSSNTTPTSNTTVPSPYPTNNTIPDRLTGQSGVGYSIEMEQEEAVSLLLIPHHPGLQLKIFDLSDEKYIKKPCKRKMGPTISQEEFDQITGLSKQDSLKALLLFDARLDDCFTEAFVQAALVRQNHKLALGGGMVDTVITGQSGNSDLPSFGVAVSGPNVTAASIVIPKCVTNPRMLSDYMKQLKSCGLPEEQSVAFMFSCCGRGYAWYRRHGNSTTDYHNVETKAFRQAFPNTPVFGFFGDGEIGNTYLPKFTEKDKKVQEVVDGEEEEVEVPYKKRKKVAFHQFSTIVILISFL